jgi:hypothetical protein
VQEGRHNFKSAISIVVAVAALIALTAGIGALAANSPPSNGGEVQAVSGQRGGVPDAAKTALPSTGLAVWAVRSVGAAVPAGPAPAMAELALDRPGGGSGAHVAQAQGVGTAAQCFFELTMSLNPGLTVTPGTGTLSTGGETGSISCYGPVRGALPAGVGTMGVDGRYGMAGGDSCAGGVASGRGAFTVPTASGPKRIEGPFVVNYYSTGVGYFTAVTDDGTVNFSGTVEFSPVVGDCLNSPMTVIRVVGQATASGA